MNIEQNNKLREKERKNTSERKKEKRKKYRASARPRVHAFQYHHIGPQSVHVSRALFIIVLLSQGSD